MLALRLAIRALIAHLARFCRPGTLLVAFSSNQKEIPEQPIGFRFVDSETLEYEVASSRLRPGPRRATSRTCSPASGCRTPTCSRTGSRNTSSRASERLHHSSMRLER